MLKVRTNTGYELWIASYFFTKRDLPPTMAKPLESSHVILTSEKMLVSISLLARSFKLLRVHLKRAIATSVIYMRTSDKLYLAQHLPADVRECHALLPIAQLILLKQRRVRPCVRHSDDGRWQAIVAECDFR
jgi:hypothetical protein